MTPQPLSFRIEVLLSIQRALWDIVTPNLRGVAMQLEPNDVRGRFIYDCFVDDEIREIVAEAETYFIADFDGATVVAFHPEYVPSSEGRDLHDGEFWVYLRREPTRPVSCKRLADA